MGYWITIHANIEYILKGKSDKKEFTIKMFKVCPYCGKIWNSQQDFLADSDLEFIGYKADFEKLENGLFFFNHKVNDCYSTLTIDALIFFNIYIGPRYSVRKTDTAECPGYCNDQNQLHRCPVMCECAYVREIASILNLKRKSFTRP